MFDVPPMRFHIDWVAAGTHQVFLYWRTTVLERYRLIAYGAGAGVGSGVGSAVGSGVVVVVVAGIDGRGRRRLGGERHRERQEREADHGQHRRPQDGGQARA